MGDPLKEIQATLSKQDKKLDRIQVLLAGDSDFKTTGLVAKVDDHEDRIGKLETKSAKTSKDSFWKTAKISGLSAAVGGAIGTLFPKTVIAKIISILSP